MRLAFWIYLIGLGFVSMIEQRNYRDRNGSLLYVHVHAAGGFGIKRKDSLTGKSNWMRAAELKGFASFDRAQQALNHYAKNRKLQEDE